MPSSRVPAPVPTAAAPSRRRRGPSTHIRARGDGGNRALEGRSREALPDTLGASRLCSLARSCRTCDRRPPTSPRERHPSRLHRATIGSSRTVPRGIWDRWSQPDLKLRREGVRLRGGCRTDPALRGLALKRNDLQHRRLLGGEFWDAIFTTPLHLFTGHANELLTGASCSAQIITPPPVRSR